MRWPLVVCPAMLREKWRLELSSRFGLDARIVDAELLLDELDSNEHRERAWIISYKGIRAPKGRDPAESDMPRRPIRARLADLLYRHADREPFLDVVIFDEAHYTRNEETSAWKTGSLLRDVTTHRLMLPATPINLGSDDLFNVLRLLDPDHFEHPEDFRNIAQANRPAIAASDAVRNQLNDRQAKMVSRVFAEGRKGFEGGITTRKYEVITKCPNRTASRDISDLVDRGILVPLSGGGRAARYALIVFELARFDKES